MVKNKEDINIILINPQGDEPSYIDLLINDGFKKSPLGLLYIATFLKMNGYMNVHILDMNEKKLKRDEFEYFLNSIDPDIVGISTYTISMGLTEQLVRHIRKLFPHITIVFGGAHASFRDVELLTELNESYVIRKEGEASFLELVSYLQYGSPKLREIKGLTYRDKNKNIIQNADRHGVRDLEGVPFPITFSMFNSSYLPTMVTSRGCPGNCIFCSNVSMFGQTFRYESAQKVFDKFLYVDYWLKEYGCEKEIIFIEDSCFTANRKRVIDICKLKQKAQINFQWECLTRLDCLDEELIYIMSQAQCRSILLGVESTSEKTLSYINKKADMDRLEKLLEYCKEHAPSLKLGLSFIIGLPGDTKSSIQSMWNYISNIWDKYDIERIDLNSNVIFPGTYQDKHASELGLRIESKAVRRTSRIMPNVSSADFSVNDLHIIMQQYFKKCAQKQNIR